MLCLIAAMDLNRVIGRRGTIPWHLPDDLSHFRELTMGHTVLMGRRTYESIGHPLPGRRNIVLSRKGFHEEGIETAASFADALRLCSPEETVFVIGGAQVYAKAMPLCERLYLTLIEADIGGDTFFPPVSESDFRLLSERHVPADLPHTFYVFERNPSVS